MHKMLFIMLFLILLASPLFSQDGNEPQSEMTETEAEKKDISAVITSVEIIGLKRTKPHVARYSLGKFVGKERSTYDQNEVFAAIKNTGVLEPVLSELVESEGDIVLRVTVDEKWSIFPVPLFFTGSGETTYGLFLYDANAFGVMDSFAVGGMYRSNGWTAVGMYNHTPNRQGYPGWFGLLMYRKEEEKNVDNKERLIRVYTAEKLKSSLGLNYSFSDLITGSAGFSFSNISLDKKNAFNAPQDGAMHIGFSPSISLRSSNWDGIFLSEEKISLSYSYNYAIIGSSFHQIGYSRNYEKSLVPGFRLKIRCGGVWVSTDDPLFEDDPSEAQVNILPSNYSALYYAGISAGLEKYIVKLRWGTLSANASWQCVFSGNDIKDLNFDHGPSGGIVFYLSRLALPAIGTNIAYNIISGLFQTSFSVGMSF